MPSYSTHKLYHVNISLENRLVTHVNKLEKGEKISRISPINFVKLLVKKLMLAILCLFKCTI